MATTVDKDNKSKSILPDMSDFYYDSVDAFDLLEVSRVFGDKTMIPAMDFAKESNVPELGYDEQYKVVCVRYYKSNDGVASYNKEIVDGMNVIDGDTVYFNVENMEFGDTASEGYIKDVTQYNIKQYCDSFGMKSLSGKDGILISRFAFMNTAELPHFERLGPASYFTGCEKISVKYSNAKSDYLTAKHHSFIEINESVTIGNKANIYNKAYEPDEEVSYIKLNNKYVQFFEKDGDLYALSTNDASQPSSITDAGVARDTVCTALHEAEEIRIAINLTTLSKSSMKFTDKYNAIGKTDAVSAILAVYESFTGDIPRFTSTGFNALGLDAYGRAICVVYCKIKGTWINLNKLVIANTHDTTSNTDFNMSGKFDANSYLYNEKVYADNLYNITRLGDDREVIHSKLFGKTSFDKLKNWTVIIGDCVFFVPPTSIRKVTQTKSTFLQPMRSKGKIYSNGHKTQQLIEMDLYFNEDRGINGVEYETELPNKNKITYYLDGLRSLVAQFKLCPFLPIDNDYINKQLHTYAVTLINLNISTVPNYPKLYKASLQLADFEYRIYMPEIPNDADDIYGEKNYFAKQIYFPIMRYYYQRLIRNGEYIKKYEFNSEEYNKAIFGSSEYYMNTCLQPMQFKDPSIRFYIPNKEDLDLKKQRKIQSLQGGSTSFKLTQTDRNIAAEVNKIYESLSSIKDIPAYNELINFHNTDESLYYCIGDNEEENKYYELKVISIDNDKVIDRDTETQELNSIIEDIGKEYTKKLSGLKSSNGVTLCNNIITNTSYGIEESNGSYISKYSINFIFDFSIDYVSAESAYEKLKAKATESSNNIGPSSSDVFKNGKVVIPITIRLKKSKDIYYFNEEDSLVDNEDGDYLTMRDKINVDSVLPCANSNSWSIDVPIQDKRFMTLCNSIANNGAVIESNSNGEDMKATLDWESTDSLKFDLYNTGEDLYITSYSASISNNFSNITLQQTDGFAPQFMGGSETEIRISMTTTNKGTVGSLEMLAELTADYARQYHIVLTQWPLKIDSEFTKFLGVNEVIIDSVQVNTVPNYPSLYQIDMIMYSTDRALRNRESLKGKDMQNFKNLTDAGRSAIRTWEYEQISEMLSETDLYPDLELPTIKELQEHGFSFLRYTNKNRLYPDPDFYFSYAHTLVSQIIRETVLNGLTEASKNMDISSTFDGVKLNNSDMTKNPELDLNPSIQSMLKGTLADTQAKRENIDGIIEDFNNLSEEASNERVLYSKQSLSKEEQAGLEFLIDKQNSIEQIWSLCPLIKGVLCEKNASSNLVNYTNLKYQNGGEDFDITSAHNIDGVSTQGNYCWNTWNDSVSAMNDNIDEYLKKEISVTNLNTVNNVPYLEPGILSYPINMLYKSSSDELLNDFINLLSPIGVGIADAGKLSGSTISSILYAAACAMSATQTYTKSKNDQRWKPVMQRILYTSDTGYGAETVNTNDFLDSEDFDFNKIRSFGPYNMKLYTKSQLERLLDVSIDDSVMPNNAQKIYLLDPYYRNADDSIKKEYIRNCCADFNFAKKAYFRIALLWIKKLAECYIIPNFAFDLMRGTILTQDKIKEILTALKVDDANNLYDTYVEYFKSNSTAIDNGKLVLGVLCAMNDDNPQFFNLLKNRDYTKLDAMVKSCLTELPAVKNGVRADLKFRKFMLALVGEGVITNVDIGVAGKGNSDTPYVKFQKGFEDAAITKASNDPRIYIQHSFYDMITHDARGRMLRAFPTFYMVFIDEGRKIGYWKLHDNFYTTSSISDIVVTKSRKIAADTATVTMSNFFNTYTSDDEEVNKNYVTNYTDVFRSIYTPRISEYAQEMEELRTNSSPVERIKLRPGIRMQIRLGYGSDASVLPVTFNGVITEVDTKDVVTFIAQGDGVELLKPIIYDKDASDIRYDNEAINYHTSNGDTPQNILRDLLTSHGSYINDLMAGTEYEQMADYVGTPINPYGIYHFGDPRFKYMSSVSEVNQNIFDAGISRTANKRNVYTNSHDLFNSEEDTVGINFHLAGKTVWDVMNICKSVYPEYIATVAPFEFRSTMFFGRPQDYYAYQYSQNGTSWYEKRKPYQQYHLYTSETDIVCNFVNASLKDFKTCCVGIYEKQGSFNSKDVEHTQPIWVDKEIYPEFQKTFYYDTQYYGMGGRKAGVASSAFDWLFGSVTQSNLIDRVCDETGQTKNHHAIASRMTLTALKENTYDMYQGALVVVGDPTVKPHDRIYINDSYNEINGCMLVKDVVESISSTDGYTTTIYPDIIATTTENAKEESIRQSAITNLAGIVTATTITFAMRAATSKLSHLASAKIAEIIGERSMPTVLTKAIEILNSTGKVSKLASSAANIARSMTLFSSLGKGAAVAGATVSLPVILSAAVIGSVVWCACGSALDWLKMEIKNSRAITLFPIKKYGRPMVAGVDGNKSLIYGSTSYNQGDEGPMRNLFGKVSNYCEERGDNLLMSVLNYTLGDVLGAASAYNHNYLQEHASSEEVIQKVINDANSSNLNLFSKTEVNFVLPRVDIKDTSQMKKVVGKIGIKGNTIKDINNDINLRNMVQVVKDDKLSTYINNGFFVIVHEEKNFNNTASTKITPVEINIGGTTMTTVNALITQKNGKNVFDIPLLHKNVMPILNDIIEMAYHNTIGTYKTNDKNLYNKNMGGTRIVLVSALIAGSTEKYENTGYSFVLQCSDNRSLAGLNKAINDIDKKCKKAHEENSSYCTSLFEHSQKDNNVYIVIRMPE